uniref:EF-hand domain-containing protein n=1 Tax=Pseudonaja textilis TaxID=8673 RepID=A0A670Z1E0_PSETE
PNRFSKVYVLQSAFTHAKYESFSHFDLNGDGVITKKELGTVMRSLQDILQETFTDQEVEDMLKEADLDEDGKVTFEEFVKMLAKKGAYRGDVGGGAANEDVSRVYCGLG